MPLPEFDKHGDLPAGVWPVSWDEVVERFGAGTPLRMRATRILSHIHDLAVRTGH